VPRGGAATVVRVVEPVRLPSLGLLPASIRAELAGQAAALQATRVRTARRDVDTAVMKLKGTGWRVGGDVRVGLPLDELLRAVKKSHADLLVLGARGVGAAERFLLGSVADAATKRSPISVLIVR
jgi:nucleotide-binding universal stress UspA family protein